VNKSKYKCWYFIVFLIILLFSSYFIYFKYTVLNDQEINYYGVDPRGLDAVVYISMGKTSSYTFIDQSIKSVRKLGMWRGPLYILTDNPMCFSNLEEYKISFIEIPKQPDIKSIKLLKTKLFEYIDNQSIREILYLDADILVTKELSTFFYDYIGLLNKEERKEEDFDYASFPDAKGHFAGFCNGCDKWHTGVMIFKRELGIQCLDTWASILSSGKYPSDQESLDNSQEYCHNAIELPSKHLLFAKDILGFLFLREYTFLHLTGANKLSEQNYIYRNFIYPYFMQLFKSRIGIPKALSKSCEPS